MSSESRIGRSEGVANINAELLASATRTATTSVDAENTYNTGAAFIVDVTGGGVSQVETATVVADITVGGDIDVTITAAGTTWSPKTIPVTVIIGDSAATTAEKIRAALELDADVTELFTISGVGGIVILTKILPAANDATLNIATATGTATGLTPAAASANTTDGSVTVDVTPKIEGYDPISGKYYTILEGTAIVAAGTTVLRVHPSLTTAANTIAKDMLPKHYKFTMTHGDVVNVIYSVAINGS